MISETASPPVQRGFPLCQLTTLKTGGAAKCFVDCRSAEEAVAAIRSAGDRGEPLLLIGGGSNVLVGDEGFPGWVIRQHSEAGIRLLSALGTTESEPGLVYVEILAGVSWDRVARFGVENGLGALALLSGIPGSTGGAVTQNIGAYGQEISTLVDRVEVFNLEENRVEQLSAAAMGYGYRTSQLKRQHSTGRRAAEESAVLKVVLRLHRGNTLISYEALAQELGCPLGSSCDPFRAREAVLRVRASRGMLAPEQMALVAPELEPVNSAGSFFTNPELPVSQAQALPPGLPRWYLNSRGYVLSAEQLQQQEIRLVLALPEPSAASPAAGSALGSAAEEALSQPLRFEASRVRVSAAWLIEQCGISRGFSLPGSEAAVSPYHTLALVNRGSARAEHILQLARFIQLRVENTFGITLKPEPVLVGESWEI